MEWSNNVVWYKRLT